MQYVYGRIYIRHPSRNAQSYDLFFGTRRTFLRTCAINLRPSPNVPFSLGYISHRAHGNTNRSADATPARRGFLRRDNESVVARSSRAARVRGVRVAIIARYSQLEDDHRRGE